MFCSKCGSQIVDGGKFCPSCGTPVDSVFVNQVQQPNNIVPKKSHKARNAIIIIVIILVLAAAGVGAAFALNHSQGTSQTTQSSDTAAVTPVKGNIDTVFDEVIYENEQLRAWWNLEYSNISYVTKNKSKTSNEYASYINKSVDGLASFANIYPYVNATAICPNKYTKTDMNDDGQDELVVWGRNPYDSEVIIGIYYYDSATSQAKLLKVNDSQFKNNTDKYTDVICTDKTIKETYSANGGETLTLYKMNGDTVEKVGEYSGYLGKAQNESELAEAQKKNSEYNNAKNNFKQDSSIEWKSFPTKDAVITLTGTIKQQTVSERLKDSSSRGCKLEQQREDENSNIESYRDYNVLVFEADNTDEKPCFSFDRYTITNLPAISYCLASDCQNRLEAHESYTKASPYIGKTVRITLKMDLSGETTIEDNLASDVYCSSSCVAKIEPVD